MNIFFLTGENSGDEIAAVIASPLLKSGHRISAWGGHALREVGVQVTKDISSLSAMGFTEVLGLATKVPSLLRKAKSDILTFKAETIVLVDYGYFNLKIARWGHQNKFRIIYLSPPKIWASRPGRAKQLRRYCHEVIVVFPFEKALFNKLGVDVLSYGHPLAVDEAATNSSSSLAILPGSRMQEVTEILPEMIKAFELSSYDHATISCAKGIELSMLERIVKRHTTKAWDTFQGDIYDMLRDKNIALVTSGTATMHCLMTNTLQVVCYKTSQLTYQIAKRLIRVPHLALPNLMAGKEIVPELIQKDCNAAFIKKKMNEVMENSNQVNIEYSNIKKQLWRPDTISCIADVIINKTK